MIEVQKQRFVGQPTSPEIQLQINEWQESPARRQEIADYLGEVTPPSEALRPMLQSIFNVTTDYYANELNLDIRSRIPPLDNIHTISPTAFTEFRNKHNFLLDLDVQAFPVDDHIAIQQMNNEAFLLYCVQHELIHLIGHRDTRTRWLRPDYVDISNSRHGFQPNKTNAFVHLEEYVTEKTNSIIFTKKWPEHPILGRMETNPEVHVVPMAIGEKIIDTISEKTGKNKATLLQDLQIAHATGDMKALRIINETLGRDFMRSLAKSQLGKDSARLLVEVANL